MMYNPSRGFADHRSDKATVLFPVVLILLFLLLIVGLFLMMKAPADIPPNDEESTLPALTETTSSAPLGQETTKTQETTVTPPPSGENSGRITSKTGTYLNLFLDYTAVDNGNTVTVTVTVGIDCYSISVGERDSLGSVSINGTTKTFSSPKITKEENTRSYITFETLVFTVPKPLNGDTTLDISASWVFNGTYGGKELSTIGLHSVVTVTP